MYVTLGYGKLLSFASQSKNLIQTFLTKVALAIVHQNASYSISRCDNKVMCELGTSRQLPWLAGSTDDSADVARRSTNLFLAATLSQMHSLGEDLGLVRGEIICCLKHLDELSRLIQIARRYAHVANQGKCDPHHISAKHEVEPRIWVGLIDCFDGKLVKIWCIPSLKVAIAARASNLLDGDVSRGRMQTWV